MHKELKQKYFHWLLSLGAKFARVVPARTGLIVFLTLVGQVSSILAFFLPLKIIILLGSEGTPRYFPEVLAALGRDTLVVWLSLATVGFYAINILAEKVIDGVTAGATETLMARSHKMVLFENQEDIAARAYQSFSRALSGFTFGVLALAGLSFVYSEMALTMACYIALASAGVIIFCAKSVEILEYVQKNLTGLMNNLSAIGFFLVFGYLVIDFVWLEPPGIIVAIISILAGRQTFGRITAAVTGLFRLYQQRQKLDVLFFHGRQLRPPELPGHSTLWDYLGPDYRKKWVPEVLKEFDALVSSEDEGQGIQLEWQQTASPQVGAFVCYQNDSVCLVRIYGKNQSVLARHEATLLADPPLELPGPAFIGSTLVRGYPCNLFRLQKGQALTRRASKQLALRMMAELLSVEPPPPLVQRYLRSKPTLVDRLNINLLDKALVAASTEKQRMASERLRFHWDVLISIFQGLPIGLNNPLINNSIMWESESGSQVLLDWEKWSLEPTGAGWPTTAAAMKELEDVYKAVASKRKSLQSIPVEHLQLAALTFELERLVLRQQLDLAVDLLPRLWALLKPVTETEKSMEVGFT